MSIQSKINQKESLEKIQKENIPEILYTKILAILSHESNLTAREIAERAGRHTRQDIQPRLTELKDKRIIKESGKEEARKVYGKREMLWNIQRQIYAVKQKGKKIDEDLILKILDSMEKMQEIEEMNWDIYKYVDSEIEENIIQESKILNSKIKGE